MANIQNGYDIFLENISLTKSKSDDLKRGRDALRENIKKWFIDSDQANPKFHMQGSFAMKTTVNPLDNDFDLDDGVYIQGYENCEIDDFPDPKTVHDWLIEAVKNHTIEDSVNKNTCVRVVYQNGYHIDIPSYIMNREVVYLSHLEKGWIESDPKAFTQWFQKKISSNSEQLRKITKYVKAWRDFSGADIKSIVITILVAEHFVNFEGNDSKSLFFTVKEIVRRLESSFVCIKPVLPYEDLLDNYSKTKAECLLKSLKYLLVEISKSIDTLDEITAYECAKIVFGDRFPTTNSSKNESADKYIKTLAPGVLGHDGRSA